MQIGKRTICLLLTSAIVSQGCQYKGVKNEKKEAVVTSIQPIDLPEESYLTLKNGVYTATGGAVQITVSDDWKINEDDSSILECKAKDREKDFISVNVTAKDLAFADCSKKSFEAYYNKIFDNYKTVQYKRTTVQGLPAIYFCYSYSKDSTDVIAYQYLIDGSMTYMICFTDASGKLVEEKNAMLEKLHICK